MNILKNITFFLVTLIISISLIETADASSSLRVSPPVMDYSGLPGDALSEVITVTNSGSRRLRLFITVNNVSFEEEDGVEEFEIKRGLESAESLANWVSITRAPLELESGETKEIPITVKIDPLAKEGIYHAYVFISDGSRRNDAEKKNSRDRATLLSINVGDGSEDILQLLEFSSEKSYVSGSPVSFNVFLENRGDTVLTPGGEFIVYNKQGREMGSVPFNEKGDSIDLNEKKVFKVVWEGDLDWGRQRARLALSYGQGGLINDILYFNVLPILPLALIFLTFLAIIVFLIHHLHKGHERKFASQGRFSRRTEYDYEEESDEHTIDLR